MQVHSLRCSNIKMVDNHVEGIYGKFSPFQFLAYMYLSFHFQTFFPSSALEIVLINYCLFFFFALNQVRAVEF